MYLTLFLSESFISIKAETAEDALRQAQEMTEEYYTFCPKDGTVYTRGSHVPCGILYRQGYLRS